MGVSEPPVRASPAIGPQRVAVDLAVNVQHLNALDDAWTTYLSAAPSAADIERDMPELTGLVRTMTGLLDELPAQCRELRAIVRDLPVDLDDELRRAVLMHPLGEQYLYALPEPPFARQVVDSCLIVEEEASREAAALWQKLQQLKEHGYAPGDIGGRMKCAILLAGGGASLVGLLLSPVNPPAGLVVGALGILVSTLAAAKGWSCNQAGSRAVTP
jgi:hypothetical protein